MAEGKAPVSVVWRSLDSVGVGGTSAPLGEKIDGSGNALLCLCPSQRARLLYQQPITNDQSPITNDQSPITNDQRQITNHQQPVIQ